LKKKELNTFYDLMNEIQSKIDQYHKNRRARAKVTQKTTENTLSLMKISLNFKQNLSGNDI
jgi:hypothetical protein